MPIIISVNFILPNEMISLTAKEQVPIKYHASNSLRYQIRSYLQVKMRITGS